MTNNYFVFSKTSQIGALDMNGLGTNTLPESYPILELPSQKEVTKLIYSPKSHKQVQACASQEIIDENHSSYQGRTTTMVRRNTMAMLPMPGSKRPEHFREINDQDLFIREEI